MANQFLRSLLATFTSRTFSLLNNHSGQSFHHEEFRSFNPSFSQYGEDMLVWSQLRELDVAKYFFLDIGAYHPYHYSTTNLLYRHGWRGINIDVDPERIRLFQQLRPEDTSIAAAISDQEEEYLYLRYASPWLDRIVKPEEENQESYHQSPKRVDKVKSQRLDKLLEEHAPSGKNLAYLNVDCEGHDLAVLRSLDWDQYSPELITVEAEDSDYAAEIRSFLQPHGYEERLAMSVTRIFLKTR